jgi:hypothetical protein
LTLTVADTNVSPQPSAVSILDIFAEVTEACPFEEDSPTISYTAFGFYALVLPAVAAPSGTLVRQEQKQNFLLMGQVLNG